MGWDDYDHEYANSADGSCQECGEDTDEPWHLYCADCFAEQQGWTRPTPAVRPCLLCGHELVPARNDGWACANPHCVLQERAER